MYIDYTQCSNQYSYLTPWENNIESTSTPLGKFARTLTKMENTQKSLVKLRNKLNKSDLKNLPQLKLKIGSQIFHDDTKSITETGDCSSSFYIRNFSRIDNTSNSHQINNRNNPLLRRQWSKQNSNKQLKNNKSLIICDLNKTTDLQIKDLSPWTKMEINKTKNTFRLKRLNCQRIRLRDIKKNLKTQS